MSAHCQFVKAQVRFSSPIKDLLLLLRPDASVLEKQVQEFTLTTDNVSDRCSFDSAYQLAHFGFLQTRILARFQISQIRKDTLLKLLDHQRLDGSSESLESECQSSYCHVDRIESVTGLGGDDSCDYDSPMSVPVIIYSPFQ